MGQTTIRSVLDLCTGPTLRAVLEDQLREYDRIESEAFRIASQRGWELEELDPARRFLKDRLSRAGLAGRHRDSRIAGFAIQDNSKGMIQVIRELHRYPGQEDAVRNLCQRLLDCQQANIQSLQDFL